MFLYLNVRILKAFDDAIIIIIEVFHVHGSILLFLPKGGHGSELVDQLLPHDYELFPAVVVPHRSAANKEENVYYYSNQLISLLFRDEEEESNLTLVSRRSYCRCSWPHPRGERVPPDP